MKLSKLPRIILILLSQIIIINLISCSTLEPERIVRENVFMILYNPKLDHALCGEYKYLGEEKYSFLKWHTLDKCNGMFCAGKLRDLPDSVLKPTPTPKPKPTPSPFDGGWNDK